MRNQQCTSPELLGLELRCVCCPMEDLWGALQRLRTQAVSEALAYKRLLHDLLVFARLRGLVQMVRPTFRLAGTQTLWQFQWAKCTPAQSTMPAP